jgi:hypothetical protein
MLSASDKGAPAPAMASSWSCNAVDSLGGGYTPTILCCRNPVLNPIARNVQIRVKECAAKHGYAFPLGRRLNDNATVVSADDSEFEGAELGQPSLKTTSVEIAAQSRPAGGEGGCYVVGDRR